MESHRIVSREQWIAARTAFLAKEKEFTRARDRLSQERRDLRHQQLLPVEMAQDGAAYRIGERREHLIERILAAVRGSADEVQVGGFGNHGHHQSVD